MKKSMDDISLKTATKRDSKDHSTVISNPKLRSPSTQNNEIPNYRRVSTGSFPESTLSQGDRKVKSCCAKHSSMETKVMNIVTPSTKSFVHSSRRSCTREKPSINRSFSTGKEMINCIKPSFKKGATNVAKSTCKVKAQVESKKDPPKSRVVPNNRRHFLSSPGSLKTNESKTIKIVKTTTTSILVKKNASPPSTSTSSRTSKVETTTTTTTTKRHILSNISCESDASDDERERVIEPMESVDIDIDEDSLNDSRSSNDGLDERKGESGNGGNEEDESIRKGKRVVEVESESESARKLNFKKPNFIDDKQDVEMGNNKLKHLDVKSNNDPQGSLYNNVIEQTTNLLIQTRKSKVQALVGAFETVISLQDCKVSLII